MAPAVAEDDIPTWLNKECTLIHNRVYKAWPTPSGGIAGHWQRPAVCPKWGKITEIGYHLTLAI